MGAGDAVDLGEIESGTGKKSGEEEVSEDAQQTTSDAQSSLKGLNHQAMSVEGDEEDDVGGDEHGDGNCPNAEATHVFAQGPVLGDLVVQLDGHGEEAQNQVGK